jgi:hypothetical protein
LASASCKPTSSAERQPPRSSVPNCVVAMLPSFRRQLTVMVNSNFASSSIRQPNTAWPRPSTGPQVFTGLDLSTVRHLINGNESGAIDLYESPKAGVREFRTPWFRLIGKSKPGTSNEIQCAVAIEKALVLRTSFRQPPPFGTTQRHSPNLGRYLARFRKARPSCTFQVRCQHSPPFRSSCELCYSPMITPRPLAYSKPTSVKPSVSPASAPFWYHSSAFR